MQPQTPKPHLLATHSPGLSPRGIANILEPRLPPLWTFTLSTSTPVMDGEPHLH